MHVVAAIILQFIRWDTNLKAVILSLVFGSVLVSINFFIVLLLLILFVYQLERSDEPFFKKSLFHRLTLLLAISLKGVNLYFLAYLGIKLLGFCAIWVACGVVSSLMIQSLFLAHMNTNKQRTSLFF